MNSTIQRGRRHDALRALCASVLAICLFWPPCHHARAEVAAAATVPVPSHGEAGDPAGYAEAVEAALNEHQHGHFEEARAHFQRAHELYPNARTLRGLGKVEFELRNYGEAVHYLRDALTARVKPLDDELRTETERLLERARVYVGEVHVDVDPGSATVSVDGVPVASGPRVSLSLVVGDHILEFRAVGRISERRSVRVRGGDETVIQVVLPVPGDVAAATAAAPPVVPSRARVRDEAPQRRKRWIWTSVGVVAVAGLAVGLALGLRDEAQTRVAEPDRSPNTPEGALLSASRAP